MSDFQSKIMRLNSTHLKDACNLVAFNIKSSHNGLEFYFRNDIKKEI